MLLILVINGNDNDDNDNDNDNSSSDNDTATVAREAQHEDNIEAIKVAKEGLAAVKEATTILQALFISAFS